MTNIQNLNSVVLAWHGVDGDTRIFRAEMTTFDGAAPAGWSSVRVYGESFAAPALASPNFAALMGPRSPSAVQLARLDPAGLGPGPAVPSSFQTTTRPAVTSSDAGQLTLAWRQPDGALASSQHTGAGWSPIVTVGRTSHSPAVAAGGGRVVLAWKTDNGVQIEGATTTGQTQPMNPRQGGMLTGDAPSLCWRGGTYLMAWKGVPGDERIFWSRSNDGLNWETPREAIPQDGGIRTIAGPAITVWRFGYILVWRGVTGDQRLWWSALALNDVGGRWNTPTPVGPSSNSNSSPALLSLSVATL